MSETVDTLKQRVVGAFVIISLAVIFLPMIFDEPHQQESNIIVPVPARPSFKITEIEKPSKPEFQRLEFNLEQQKVVEQETSVTSTDHQLTNQTEVASSETVSASGTKSMEITESASAKQLDDSQAISAPGVKHLPIFKNVWMVQLGIFSKVENAYQLRDKLRKDGFDGHTQKIALNGTMAIKVFTGPFVDKAEAEKIKIKLDKKYKVESRVIFFDA